MSLFSIKRASVLSLSALSLVFGFQAVALTATQTVEKEVTTTTEDGLTITTLAPADIVTPGETVVYTVNLLNDSAEPATDLVLAMPVPADVRYLEGSADRDGAVVLYSIDGGTTFAERTELVLPAVGGGTRTARSEDITTIQWTIAGPVEVGAQDKIAFKGRLK